MAYPVCEGIYMQGFHSRKDDYPGPNPFYYKKDINQRASSGSAVEQDWSIMRVRSQLVVRHERCHYLAS